MTYKKELEEVPCICGSKDYTIRFTERGFNIVKCNQCGLIFTNPRHTKESQDALYEAAAKIAKNGPMHSLIGTKQDTRPFMRDVDERFTELLNYMKENAPGKKMLDIGAGAGRLLEMAAEAGFDAEGFDVVGGRVEKTEDGIPMTYAPTVKEAGYPSNHFDVITMWEVLEHVQDPAPTLKEIRRILKKDGLLIIQCPNGEFALRKTWIFENILPFMRNHLVNKQCGYFFPEAHLYFFSMKRLIDLLEECGLEHKHSLVFRMYKERSMTALVLHELIYYQAKIVNWLSRGKSDNNVFLLVSATKGGEKNG